MTKLLLMVRPKNKKLNKHLNKKQLNKKIRELEEDTKVLNKLYFIRHLYNGKSMKEATDLEKISILTAYDWLNRWNENRIEGLRTRPRSGRPGRLSLEDKEILDAKFLETEFLTTEKAHQIIKETFGLDFTLKHVRTILHQLDYFYSESTNESCENQRVLFKKTN